MELHPQIAVLAPLVGTWRGQGHGEYPTIESFDYTEELVFESTGKPFLFYRQRTWSPEGAPMHTETGFLRAPDDGAAEFVLAQPTGQTELAEGPVVQTGAGGAISLEIALEARVTNSATAKVVGSTRRTYRLSGDDLSFDFAMAAVGVPMTHHLSSVLRRSPS